MSNLVQYAVLATGVAALYVWITLGVVVTFRGSGILNLAQGAYVVFGMHLMHDLTVTRDMAIAPALIITVASCAFVGLATYWLVIPPLHGLAPRRTNVVQALQRR